jgi:hypothetical protein
MAERFQFAIESARRFVALAESLTGEAKVAALAAAESLTRKAALIREGRS